MVTANNVLIRTKGYTRRWISTTSSSTVKRTQGEVLRSRFSYRQFREIVLLFVLDDIENLATTLSSYFRIVFSVEQSNVT